MNRLPAHRQDHGLAAGSGQKRHQGLVGEPILGGSAADAFGSAAFSTAFTAALASGGVEAPGVGDTCDPGEVGGDVATASGARLDCLTSGSG